MKRKLEITLLLTVIGLSPRASTSQGRVVTATARVTLAVIPPPGVSFASTSRIRNASLLNQANDGGLTIRTSSNVAVFLDSSVNRKMLGIKYLASGVTKTLTSKEFNGVSKVEVVYLGS